MTGPLAKRKRWRRLLRVFAPELFACVGQAAKARDLTYCPEAALKSRPRVFLDLLGWLLRYMERNEFYFAYGMDQSGFTDLWYYGGVIDQRNLRNVLNRRYIHGRHRTSYVGVAADKFVNGVYLSALGLPTPPIVGLLERDSVRLPPGWDPLPHTAILEREGLDVACKGVVGGCGLEVAMLKVRGGVLYVNGTRGELDALVQRIGERGVLQERIRQHPDMEKVSPTAVCTVRVVTIWTDLGPKEFAGGFRVGIRGSHVDNWEAGGLLGGVDLETGRLSEYFIGKPGKHNSICDRHPETGCRFGDFIVPYIDEVVALARRAHRMFWGIHSLGWDIAVTAEGPTILECNDEWGMPFMQIANGGLVPRYRDWCRGHGWPGGGEVAPAELRGKQRRKGRGRTVRRLKRLCRVLLPGVGAAWREAIGRTQLTYFGREPHKSSARIFLEQLAWLLRYQEKHQFYYAYGMDRAAFGSIWPYGSVIEQRDDRNWRNRRFVRGRQFTSYSGLAADKFVNGMYLSALGLPTPPVVALLEGDGIRHAPDWEFRSHETLLDRGDLDLVCKHILGGGGKEVVMLEIRGGVLILNDRAESLDTLLALAGSPCVLQERIWQHPELDKVSPGAVATMRVVTVLRDGKPHVFAAGMRLGVAGSHVDNWSSGGLLGGIDLRTGRLGCRFIRKPGKGPQRYARHPDTGQRFSDVRVPFVSDAAALAVRAHEMLWGFHSLGWDIAFTARGPVILECNDEWSLPVSQVSSGPLAKKFFEWARMDEEKNR